jgi:hypothetical protein
MSSWDPGKALPKAQDRIRATMVDLALGRTPSDSGVRSSILRENPVTPAVGFDLRASGQRTDAQFLSSSRLNGLSLQPGLEDESEDKAVGENRGDDTRIQELLARLRDVQGQLDARQATPEAPRRTF